MPTGYSCPANWVVGGMYVAVAMRVGLELEGGTTLSASVEVEFEKNG